MARPMVIVRCGQGGLPFLEVDGHSQPPFGELLARRASIGKELRAELCRLFAIEAGAVTILVNVNAFTSLILDGAGFPADPWPAASAVSRIMHGHFPSGCACTLHFRARRPRPSIF